MLLDLKALDLYPANISVISVGDSLHGHDRSETSTSCSHVFGLTFTGFGKVSVFLF